MEIEKREEAYRFYISDALKTMIENVANFTGGHVMKDRYRDIIYPAEPLEPVESEKQAEEIINRMKRKLKGG